MLTRHKSQKEKINKQTIEQHHTVKFRSHNEISFKQKSAHNIDLSIDL